MTTWPTKPYRIAQRRQIVDTSDSSLVGAWGGKIVAGVVPDESGNGNDGVPDGVVSASSVIGNMLVYGGAAGTQLACGGVNTFPLSDLTISCWVLTTGQAANGYLFNYFESSSNQWGVLIDNSNDIKIFDDIDNAGANLYTTSLIVDKWHHVVAVMDSLENLLYIDGELVGSGTSSSDYWSSVAGYLLQGRDKITGGSYLNGMQTDVEIHNEAKDLAWVQAQYALGAPAVQFGTDWGVTESLANETGGYLGEGSSPFEIINGNARISTDTINGQLAKVIEGRDNNCFVSLPTSLYAASPTEATFGTWDLWLKKQDGSTNNIFIASDAQTLGVAENGYRLRVTNGEVLKLQRVTAGATTDLVDTVTAAITPNVWTRITITRAYDGEFYLYVDGVSQGSATDTTHTTCTYFNIDCDLNDVFAYADLQGGHGIVKYLGVFAP